MKERVSVKNRMRSSTMIIVTGTTAVATRSNTTCSQGESGAQPCASGSGGHSGGAQVVVLAGVAVVVGVVVVPVVVIGSGDVVGGCTLLVAR